MNARLFKKTIEEYRCILRDAPGGTDPRAVVDLDSNIWLEGARKCLTLVERYLPRGSRILDYGCGMGWLAAVLSEMGYRVAGVDIDIGSQPEVAGKAYASPWTGLEAEQENPTLLTDLWGRLSDRYGVDFKVFDGKSVPFEDGSFDAVMAHGVYEHISPEYLPHAISEISRILLEGGLFFIFRTPRKGAYLETLAGCLGLGTHEIVYGEADVVSTVKSYGFHTLRKETSDMLPAFAPVCMNLYNRLAPALARFDRFLLTTSLRKYAHHMTLVFQKSANEGPRHAGGETPPGPPDMTC